jgi:hypothetical protein
MLRFPKIDNMRDRPLFDGPNNATFAGLIIRILDEIKSKTKPLYLHPLQQGRDRNP